MLEYLCLLIALEKNTIIYRTLMLCYPACGHHWKTLATRLLAVGFYRASYAKRGVGSRNFVHPSVCHTRAL